MTAPPRHGARAARVALVSTYFAMFDEQMPAGFRADREQVARRYADAVGEHFDVTYTGLLTSEADGIAANELLRAVEPDAVVFAPAMAAPRRTPLARSTASSLRWWSGTRPRTRTWAPISRRRSPR